LQDHLPVEQVCVAVAHFDMAELAPDARTEQLEIAGATLQQSLDPAAGRLVAAAWFDFGADTPGRLLLVIHHLVVDGVSWRILIEDLIAAYTQLERGEAIALSARTTSFKSWAARLMGRAQDADVLGELELWKSTCLGAPELPVDRPVDPSRASYGETEGLTTQLPAGDTHALLTIVPQAYHSRINDALLAALSVALADWRAARGEKETAILLDLEGHGREDGFAAVDLSRTVGWFTTMFPVRLDAGRLDPEEVKNGGPAAGVALRGTKERLRRVPHGGIGWGLLRYLNEKTADALRLLPRAKISFNYLGRFDESTATGWREAAESSGPAIAADRGRDHLLEIVALVRGGALQTEWRWWPAAHDRASIVDLAERFEAALRGLIHHCTTVDTRYTPSDFPLVQLDEARLAVLQQRYPDVEDVWPLAPMQQVMLSHAHRSPHSVAYHERLCLTLERSVDGAALETAWRELAIRHAALRIAIFDEPGQSPLQVVRRDARPPWRAADCSGLSTEAAECRLQEVLAEDRTQGFDLASGVLLRACLVRHSPLRHTLVLSFHHLLLDGWSIPVLLRDFLELYRAALQRRPAALPPVRPYRDYLAWRGQADRTAGEAFWRNRLSGMSAPFRLDLASGDPQSSPDTADEHRMTLSEGLTAELQALASARRLTMNTLIQGAWALALGRHAPGRGAPRHLADGEVIFGMTTSGRPGELAGVERMVGLCINLLPRRVRLDPAARAADWLADLQQRQAEEQGHDGCSLLDIEGWSGASSDEALFDSVVVFENYPVAASLASDASAEVDTDAPSAEIKVSAVTSFEDGIDFPLCLVAAPGARMSFRLIFSRRRFDAAAVKDLADEFIDLLATIALDPDQRLATLWPCAERADRPNHVTRGRAGGAPNPGRTS
jgi:non-ribosomal peptide synthase protein (TIGR01720 family)